MENLLGLDSNLENTDAIETEITAPETDALASESIIPDYSTQPQLAVPANKTIDPFDRAFSSAAKESQQQYNSPTNVTYFDPEQKERYKQDKTIYNDNFNPNVDYEQVAYENWDKWDAISTGLNRFKDSFSSSFKEYFRYDRIGKAIFNLDMDYLTPDESDLNRMAYEQHRSEIENPIYYAPGTENDFLTKGFLAESIGSLGFTLGTLAGVGTEQLATKGIEAGLAYTGFGAAAIPEIEAAADVKAAKGLSSVWKNITTFFTGKALNSAEYLSQELRTTSQISQTTKNLSTVDDMILTGMQESNVVMNPGRYGTKFWNNALKLATKVPFAGEIADAARLYRAGKGTLTTAELFKIGAGGLRRAVGEWQLASGEAAMEAGGNYADLLDQLKDEYRMTHGGQDPLGQDLLDLKNIALKSAGQDFGLNVGILGVMNKIQWGNLFGKFAGESAALSKLRMNLGQEASELGIMTVSKQGLTKSYMKGFLGTAGLLPKIAEDFSRKQAAWEFGKSAMKGLTRIELSEGIQENLQDIATSGLKNHYVDLYKQDPTTWGDSFHDALKEQVSKQGLKTFASGALTGVFLGPTMHIIEHGSKAMDKNYKAHREALGKSVEYLNNFYKTDSKNILKEQVKNIKLQTMYNSNMKEALQEGDIYQYNNNKDSAFIQAIMHAKRTGTLSNFTNFLKGYGQMTNEEFKQAFNYSPEELGSATAAELADGLAKSAQEYSDIYDHYQTKFGMYMQVQDHINDPMARQKYSVKVSALLDAISTAAFVESKSKATIKRQAGIRQSLDKYESIGQSLAGGFSSLVNPEKLNDQLLLSKAELSTLKKSITPDLSDEERDKTLKEIDKKQREYDLLSKIKEAAYQITEIEDPDDPSKTMKIFTAKGFNKSHETAGLVADLMSEYLQLRNDRAGIETVVNRDEILYAMNDIYDYISLGQDHQEYVDAVNLLNDPDTFGQYHERLMDARVAAHAGSLHDQFKDLAGMSSLAQKFMDDNKDIFDKLEDFSNRPSGTYQNMYELKKINDKLLELSRGVVEEQTKNLIAEAREREEKAAAVEKEAREREAQLNKIRQSKLAKPLRSMLEEAAANNDEELHSEINEYFRMRYNMEELEKFPFEELDRTKRIVTRYYTDNNGNPIAFEKRQTVPVEFDGMPIDNMDALLTYLYALEEAFYMKEQAAEAASKLTEEKSAENITKLDEVKDDLANHVGNPVMFNGQKGTLQVEDNSYVVNFEDGTSVKVGDIKEGETTTFSDVTELSPAHSSLDEETKNELGADPDTISDTNQDGTMRVLLDENLETATINGVVWTLEKDENGFVVGLVNKFVKKKGKSSKTFIRRLSVKDKKGPGIEYAARINQFIMKMREMPDNIEDLTDESEVLDGAIAEAEKIMLTEMSAERRSEELVLNYQLKKLLNDQIPDDILEIKAKFDHPFKRNQLSNDDLMKLFMWADDMDKKIIKKFRLQLTNPIISAARASLNKDYINAISEKINARGSKKDSGKRSQRATKTSSKEKKSSKRLIEELKPSESKRSDTKGKPKSAKQKAGKGTVKSAVDAVQTEISFPTDAIETSEVSTAEPIQKLPTIEGAERINSINGDKINQILSMIDPLATPRVDEPTDTSNPDNAFTSLLNNLTCER